MREQSLQITLEEVQKGLDICAGQILSMLPEYTTSFPTASSTGLFYGKTDNEDWTNGFWTGEIWLAYEFCRRECLKEAALSQCESFRKRIRRKIAVNTHDMGFLYSPSCVAAYRLTGNEEAGNTALMAADQLLTMYRSKGEFIQSYNLPKCQEEYRMIIDCLMNIPLLYWASETTGDNKYRDAALKHFMTSKAVLVREDGSVSQAALFDVITGKHLYNFTRQGYSDDSAWARGQAWAVYGSAVTYRYTGCEEALHMFRQVAGYFIEHLPPDMVPYFDLTITEGREWPRDASAAAIAACGMLEMTGYLNTAEALFYRSNAERIMKALYDRCSVKDFHRSNGLLMHSTYCCKTPDNKMIQDIGRDECCSFGDYFYLEGLMRLYRNWKAYW